MDHSRFRVPPSVGPVLSGHSEGTPRRGYRFPAGVVAEIRDGEQVFSCDAQNLSRSGVLISGPIPTPSADTVQLTLKPPTGNLEVHLPARVIRVEPTGEGLQIALQFVDPDDSQKQALEDLLARLLQHGQNTGPLDGLTPATPAHEVKKTLEAIPLAQRISLASRAGLKEREYLRFDANASVLDSLVRNPSLNVTEARAVAVSPHLSPATIELLARDSRFRGDEELRMILATHPRVPITTAEALTADFKSPQIRKLLAKPGVSQALRDKLFRKLTRG